MMGRLNTKSSEKRHFFFLVHVVVVVYLGRGIFHTGPVSFFSESVFGIALELQE